MNLTSWFWNLTKTTSSPPSTAEVKEWSYTSTHPIRLHGVVLKNKHRDNFNFTFT
jgi:hypothetical protein